MLTVCALILFLNETGLAYVHECQPETIEAANFAINTGSTEYEIKAWEHMYVVHMINIMWLLANLIMSESNQVQRSRWFWAMFIELTSHTIRALIFHSMIKAQLRNAIPLFCLTNYTVLFLLVRFLTSKELKVTEKCRKKLFELKRLGLKKNNGHHHCFYITKEIYMTINGQSYLLPGRTFKVHERLCPSSEHLQRDEFIGILNAPYNIIPTL